MQVNVGNREFCFVIIMVILLLIFYNFHTGGVLAGAGDQVAATCPASIIRTAESYTAAVAGAGDRRGGQRACLGLNIKYYTLAFH